MKPSWDDAPDWAQWLAMDSLGHWYWYEIKPVDYGGYWATSGKCAYVKNQPASYKDSLEPRP